ncbi:MAG: HNH endonuclease [Bryobacteraceae bacterium]
MTDISAEVRRRAGHRCEYCLIPQAAFRRPFHIEHIIAKQHGGPTQLDNLALACWQCNLKKGPNLTGLDPETGDIVRLFHPRTDNWADHFTLRKLSGKPGRIEIVG